jgi:hypothetical protein
LQTKSAQLAILVSEDKADSAADLAACLAGPGLKNLISNKRFGDNERSEVRPVVSANDG